MTLRLADTPAPRVNPHRTPGRVIRAERAAQTPDSHENPPSVFGGRIAPISWVGWLVAEWLPRGSWLVVVGDQTISGRVVDIRFGLCL